MEASINSPFLLGAIITLAIHNTKLSAGNISIDQKTKKHEDQYAGVISATLFKQGYLSRSISFEVNPSYKHSKSRSSI